VLVKRFSEVLVKRFGLYVLGLCSTKGLRVGLLFGSCSRLSEDGRGVGDVAMVESPSDQRERNPSSY
jgi:hypothetical protein